MNKIARDYLGKEIHLGDKVHRHYRPSKNKHVQHTDETESQPSDSDK